MARSKPPKAPSRPTVKRLFALSGNRCAFPGCPTPLVDRHTGSVVGEVCHIKGEKPSAPRYDLAQDDRDRHGFENLVLLCNVHHKVIDDGPGEFPVDRLVTMKQQHETRIDGKEFVDDATTKTFASAAMKFFMIDKSVIQAANITGGQVAHTITNNYLNPADEEPVRLEGCISFSAGMQPFGCPYLELMVVCRSRRPAKIRQAMLCLVSKGIMAAYQEGFGSDMGYVPVPNMDDEEMRIVLFPNRRPTCPEGFVLQRDDAMKFGFPVFAGPVGLFLDRPPSALSLRVQLFDNSEQTVVAGKEIWHVLKDIVDLAQKTQCTPMFPPVSIEVRVHSASLPDMNLDGTVNPNPIMFRPESDSRRNV
jgi:hypothetical protein